MARVNGEGPRGAKIMIVGECPTVNDLRENRPFTGGLGKELTRMLHEAGIVRSECYLTFLVKEKVPGGNMDYMFAKNKTEAKGTGLGEVEGKFPRVQMITAVQELWDEIETVNPNIVITLGESPLWAVSCNSGITKWRGSILESRCPLAGNRRNFKLLPTYSPGKIQVRWEWRFIAVQDLRRAARDSGFPEIRYPAYDFVVRPSFDVAMVWLESVLKRATTATDNHSPTRSPAPGTNGMGQSNASQPRKIRLACDIETRCGHIACIGFASSTTEAICIPLMDTNNPDGYWPIEEEIAIVLKIREVMTHPAIEIVGQNFLYDAQYLAKHWGFVGNVTHDTMIEHHVAFAGLEKGLHFLSAMYCDFHQYWKDEGKTWDPRYVNEEQLWVYNCKDCVNTFEVSYAIEQTIQSLGLEKPRAHQMRLFFPTLRMMLRGVRIDQKLRGQMSLQLMEASAVRQQWLTDVASDTVPKPKSKTAKPWYNSPKQLATYLYDTLHLPKQKQRKTGAVTTDDEALAKLRKREPALRSFFDTISELRSIGVFWNTFVKAPLDHDGRIRCSYNIAGTETYRYSSSADAFGYGCVPAEAEVLTEFGWVRIDEICGGDKIAAWDQGVIRFEIAEPYRGTTANGWFICRGKQIAQCLTDGHRVGFYNKHLQSFSVSPASDVAKRSNIAIPLGGRLLTGNLTFSSPRLLVMTLADGSYEGNCVRVAFKKARKIERFKQLCRKYGVDYTIQSSRPGYTRFSFRRPEDWPKKCWDSWVYQLNHDTAESMVDEVQYWDAHVRKNSYIFYSSDRKQAELVQTLAHLTNRSATIRWTEQSEESWSDTVMWSVNIKPRWYARIQSKHWHRESYTGDVYCVQVPSSFFLMRWEGKISVTGNTNLQNIPKGTEDD